jgi:hypothetical protein
MRDLIERGADWLAYNFPVSSMVLSTKAAYATECALVTIRAIWKARNTIKAEGYVFRDSSALSSFQFVLRDMK